MDSNNYNQIQSSNGFENFNPDNLFMMRKFDDIGDNENVPDPYFGGPEGFQHVYDMLKRTCSNLLEYIINKHQIN